MPERCRCRAANLADSVDDGHGDVGDRHDARLIHRAGDIDLLRVEGGHEHIDLRVGEVLREPSRQLHANLVGVLARHMDAPQEGVEDGAICAHLIACLCRAALSARRNRQLGMVVHHDAKHIPGANVVLIVG